MSVDLWPKRIYFNGRSGCIRNAPHMLYLEAAPSLPGCVPIAEIDYAPGTIAQLREPTGKMRDMEEHERAACDTLIARLP